MSEEKESKVIAVKGHVLMRKMVSKTGKPFVTEDGEEIIKNIAERHADGILNSSFSKDWEVIDDSRKGKNVDVKAANLAKIKALAEKANANAAALKVELAIAEGNVNKAKEETKEEAPKKAGRPAKAKEETK